MDESAISPDHVDGKVLAEMGSKVVQTITLPESYHTTIIACGSAAGEFVLPVFLFPRKTVPTTILDNAVVEGTGVIGTEKGWVNSTAML